MSLLACRRCGLVLEVAEPVASPTRLCQRCTATMRPISARDATSLRLLYGTRALNAIHRSAQRPTL